MARQLAMQMSFELHDRRSLFFSLSLSPQHLFSCALSKIKYIFVRSGNASFTASSVHWSIRPSVPPSVSDFVCLVIRQTDSNNNNNNNIASLQCPQNQCKCNERRINFAKCKVKEKSKKKNKTNSIFMCVPNKQILICQFFAMPCRKYLWAILT